MTQNSEIRLDISDEILKETIGVLREKFGPPGGLLHHFSLQIKGFTNRVILRNG
jgi:hypothetical protein